jgi:pantoate--beta-alanine ligase
MGALHEGHGALIRTGALLARERGWPGGCVVTIFVNPTQFNESADFDRYPRTPDADAALCERAGASAVFAPDPASVYPPGQNVPVPPLPRVAVEPALEDAHRPGHFAGVCQVVHRLFALCRPGAAVFGEKDWQQLQVIRAMARDHGPAVEIIGAPTVREPDGLAMSSRNRFLSASDRVRARAISRALHAAREQTQPDDAERAMRDVLAREGIVPDYAVVREAEALVRSPGEPRRPGLPYRAVIAARVGSVRLLDNASWPE